MLLEQPFQSWEKRLAMHLFPSAGRTLLEMLLLEWNYRLLATPTASDLLLIEHGMTPPPIYGALIWLTPEEIASPNHLSLPLSVEDLWRKLEDQFHSPSSFRLHLRIALNLATSVHWRHQTYTTQLINLSDMGCRFLHHCELAPGEELELHLPGEGITLAGKVIYGMERSDLGDDITEIGLLFHCPPIELRTRLRELIVATYLMRIRGKMEEETFWQGLDFFRLSPTLSERLRRLSPVLAQ
jgi:hypothetical protein